MKRRKSVIAMRLSLFVAMALYLGIGLSLRAQNNGNGNGNGKTTPGQVKQQLRQAARLNAAPVTRAVTKKFAGANPANTIKSPLAAKAGTVTAGGGVVIMANMAPPGTPPDYFGVGNYANSPFVQLDLAGQPVPGTGIRKFVDTLPPLCALGVNNLGQCIPLAAADTGNYGFQGIPGDFYRIGLKEFSTKMHSDLPATNLRGYVQLDTNMNPVGTQQYLGPLILATRNRPTRLLFKNMLTTDLKLPTDTTYMGAGLVRDANNNSAYSSKKRAGVHLHGGNTPWISDGTTHQWLTPAGGDLQPAAPGFQKGFSFQNVPDMVGPGKLIPNPALNDGLATYYWTNQQSGRLLWYHDHAYGITRLNAYAGEAAGYLLVDPAQETPLKAAGVPGTIFTKPTGEIDLVASDVTHVIPLVIQDKTFVPDSGVAGGQLAAQDPTWDVTGWGGAGSLWYPHVYMPNQNPADMSGANGFGRWDYGPWFWPPQNPSTFVATGQPYACTSIATPLTGWAFPPLMCPGTPEPSRPAPSNSPSGVPEGFMDTPVVNGTAYPTLTVNPAAYRFQVLNGANDRAWNLGLYLADPVTISVTAGGSGYSAAPVVTINGCTGLTASAVVVGGVITEINYTPTVLGVPPVCTAPVSVTVTDAGTGAAFVTSQNTDVRMVPAVAAASRNIPDCAPSTALTMEGGGLINAANAAGVLVNNTKTGLPVNCWPQYNSTFFGPLSWPTDGRPGGVPDPTYAGPPIIQIGSEGGLMPSLAVIPSTPVSYDYNKRSITVLNVLNHGLYLGGAERADIIVDFSQFAGKTLILYNDAPAPVPASDPRIDYYTNNPDFSDTGGAVGTIAGYGPNTRTVMQIVVTSTAPAPALNIPALATAIPTIFAQTQDPVIIPEQAYPAANGGSANNNYARIQDNSIGFWNGGSLGGLLLTNGGSGYTSAPAVSITGGGAVTNATAVAVLAPTALASITLTNGGTGYTSVPGVTITGGGGSGATATAVMAPTGNVKSVSMTDPGAGYTCTPTVVFTGGGGSGAAGTATRQGGRITAVTITNGGSGYSTAPAVSFSLATGCTRARGAVATAAVGKAVASVTLVGVGSGYTSVPLVGFTGGGGTGAAATAVLPPRPVGSLTLLTAGSGYTSAPAVSITGGGGAGATAIGTPPTVPMLPKTIQELFTLDYGRMNATLGVELPFTNFLTQTTIPYGYSDPPTEIFKDGETQVWKITHNGVDTHFVHFHLFTVQVINRVGWDGAIKPPDPNEMSFKDTVRMNPLEDIVVALRPFKQSLPWPVPNSSRPMDPTAPVGQATPNEFTDIDPTNQPAAVINQAINFGWEFVWHCHILGHEENDMMRAMIMAVAPTVPTISAASGGTNRAPTVVVSLAAAATPTTSVPTGFTVQRAVVTGGVIGAWSAGVSVPAVVVGTNATATYTDTSVARGTTYAYRAIANNLVGYTQTYAPPAAGYPNVSADSTVSAVVQITR
jgi:FtsP/CotA-like multicopper oxidase with cupredoxin domain